MADLCQRDHVDPRQRVASEITTLSKMQDSPLSHLRSRSRRESNGEQRKSEFDPSHDENGPIESIDQSIEQDRPGG